MNKINELENRSGCSLNEDNININIGESNNTKREVVGDEDEFDFQNS